MASAIGKGTGTRWLRLVLACSVVVLAVWTWVDAASARMTRAEWEQVATAEGWPLDPTDPSTAKGGPDKIYRLDCTYVHNVGRLWVLINNFCQIGEEYGDFYTSCLSAEWPAGSGNEYLFVAGPWIGALLPEQTSSGGEIFLPHVSTTAYQHEFRPDRNKVSADVHDTYEGAPNGNRIGGTGAANDDGDRNIDGSPKVDEEFLNGEDDDGDGRIDEDFAAISQQMFAVEVRDDTPEAKARFQEHVPLNIRLRQTTYAWSTAGTNDFVGIDYQFTNVGQDALREVYLSFFVDADVGPYSNSSNFEDDRFDRLDTLVTLEDPTSPLTECQVRQFHLQMAYMWDELDDPKRGGNLGGDVPGFAGTVLLGHTTDPLNNPLFLRQLNRDGYTYLPKGPGKVGWLNVQYFSGTGGNPYSQGGDPQLDEERYDLMCGHNCYLQGHRGATGQLEYSEDEIRTRDKFSDLRVPYREPTSPKDYRYIISVGPFPLLAPDSTVTMSLAYVVGEGRDGLISNARNLVGIVWEGDWQDVDGNPLTGYVKAGNPVYPLGIVGRETCVINPTSGHENKELQVDQDCVDRDSAAVSVRIKGTDCTPNNMVNLDCDPANPGASLCTPRPDDAKQGAEYWRHWVSTTPPPPPNTNLRINAASPAYTFAVPYAHGAPGGGSISTCPVLRYETDAKGDTTYEMRSCVVLPGKDGRVVLQWDNASEMVGNPVDHTDDFRGYRVWRAANWKRPVGTTSPDRDQWELLADYAVPQIADTTIAVALALAPSRGYVLAEPATVRALAAANDSVRAYLPGYFACGADPYQTGYPLVNKGWLYCVTDTTVRDPVLINGAPDEAIVQPANPGKGLLEVRVTHLPVGRYQYVDGHVINGLAYFYAVTAYRYSQTALGKQELHSLAVATEPDLVVPQAASRTDLKGIRVIPNPYIDKADWDLVAAPQGYLAPTGTKIEFHGLPRGQYTVRIFTLSGDLVKEIRDTDAAARAVTNGAGDDTDGTAEWNLVTRNGQDVTSGIYMYTVEAPSLGTQTGKFIIVRGRGGVIR